MYKSDQYELIDSPMEQHDDSSQEHTGIGMVAFWILKRRRAHWQLEDLFAHPQAKIDLL